MSNEEMEQQEKQKELRMLEHLDDKSTQLQEEGKYSEALQCMEKGLVLRQHFFGPESPQVWDACQTVGDMCNLLAMTYLQQENFAVVLELLQKAEILTERYPSGRAVTYNNLACLYRRQGKLHKALSYLTQAITIESKIQNLAQKADTHLNMSAVLSQLGKHQSALTHAQSALILLQEELQIQKTPPNEVVSTSNNAVATSRLDRVSVLGIAYHNVGVEQEFLRLWDDSLQTYTKGVEIATQFLGKQHGIVITLQNALVLAGRRVKTMTRNDGAGNEKDIEKSRSKSSLSKTISSARHQRD